MDLSILKFSDFTAHSIFYKNKCKNNDLLKEYWDGCTSIYVDNNYPVFQSGMFSNNLEEHLETLNCRHWQDGAKKVLDAGCGIGTVTNFFARKHPEATFAGLTISPAQVEAAKANAPINCVFSVGSYDAIPFENDSFDFVYFYQSIGYRPLVDVLRETHRVLKPGGRLLISDMCAVDDPDPQQARQIKQLQDIWHYMCYPAWYHLKAAANAQFKMVAFNPNMNAIVDFDSWIHLVNNGLGSFHQNEVPFAPIKISEFLYEK